MPDFAEAHNNLGNALNDSGQFNEAVTSYRNALVIKPDFAEAHNNLGGSLKDTGQFDNALASFYRAIAIKPNYTAAHSNLLFTLSYTATTTQADYLKEAQCYGEIVAKNVAGKFSTWQCNPNPQRLRVGIVSGDLRSHPVGYFTESLLEQLDANRVELIAYTNNPMSDELTARIKPYFSQWRQVFDLNDKAAAHLIQQDGIHVLLDLSGHTAKNRLPVFAWKPAPVQVSWLGYFASTGVAEMDYLLADEHIAPSVDENHFTEKIWRMPNSYLCFTAPNLDLAILPLPACSSGQITFGCFNNLTKMNEAVIALWSRVLLAVPNSRLFLKTKQLNTSAVCDTTRQQFAAHGITADRLLLEGASPRAKLLAAYQRVDIALDPFPYPGGTTSVEALWMGVPVLTKRGDRFLSRMGESIVYNAGLADWMAIDDDDYVAKAVSHTANLERLAALHAGLRQQVLASPLFEAGQFARNFEAALWGMCQNWQTQQGTSK
jgi:predicted O-linked N-acetylglucosamine transferase (SPINDLY family)